MKNFAVFGLTAFLLLPLISHASIDQDLRYGSSGPEVSELQEYLVAGGFLTSQPTGNFYSLTRKAVVAYQASVNLPATGFVGTLTRASINTDLADNTSPEEAEATPVVTVSSDTSALQKQLSDLLVQVQALVAQQKAQTDATIATNQAVAQVVQNTAPVFGSISQATSTPAVPVAILVNGNEGTTTDTIYGGSCSLYTPKVSVQYSDGSIKNDAFKYITTDGNDHGVNVGGSFNYRSSLKTGTDEIIIESGNLQSHIELNIANPSGLPFTPLDPVRVCQINALCTGGYGLVNINNQDQLYSTTTDSCN